MFNAIHDVIADISKGRMVIVNITPFLYINICLVEPSLHAGLLFYGIYRFLSVRALQIWQ